MAAEYPVSNKAGYPAKYADLSWKTRDQKVRNLQFLENVFMKVFYCGEPKMN